MASIDHSEPVEVDEFARVFVKSVDQLPPDADTYHDPERGYYFKLYLNDVSEEEATPLLEKARDNFDVELVRRVSQGPIYKERVYVDDPAEVPDDKNVQEGPSGGLYYETGVQRVAVDDQADTRNVAVIYWDDVELGDDIVFETPEGDETFAQITNIEEREEEADVVHVDADGEQYRATPGAYSVDDGEEKALSSSVRMSKASEWTSYEGPRGGQGWRNVHSGEVVYQENPPSDAEGSEGAYDEDFDPSEPPDEGHAPGWTGPPEGESDLWPGQSVEIFEDGAYEYGEVVAVDGGHVDVELDSGEGTTVPLGEVTSREAADGEAVETQPDPWEDVKRFEGDETAQELIDTVNSEPGEGFTFKRNLEVDNPFERDVWFVGITSENLEAGDMEKEDVLDFYHDWLDLLEEEPALHIGGYAFEDGEKVSIDLSVAVEDAEEAEALGERFNQESIANLHVAEEKGWDEGLIFTGGEGESPVEGPDDVQNALSDIESLAKRLMKGKTKMFDHEKSYDTSVGVLTGTQIAYMALHGEFDPTAEDLVPVEEKSEGALTSGSEGVHSARYSEDDEEDEDVEKNDGQWVSFVGPQGGSGWVNLATGEKRYQVERPGEGPGEQEMAEGWTEPSDGFEGVEYGQEVEIYETMDDEYYRGTYTGDVSNTIETEDGGVFTPSDPTVELTAVEEDYDKHDEWFEDSEYEPEEYWGSVEEEIPSDAPEEFQQFEVGQEVAMDLPGQDDPVPLPIFGYVDEEANFPNSEDSLAFHYDDLEEAVGTKDMYDRWGTPGDASPTITGGAGQVGNVIMGDAEEVMSEEEGEEEESEGSDGAHSWDEDDFGEDEWLESHDIKPGTTFNYEIGGEAYPAQVVGATSMMDDGELSHAVLEIEPNSDDPHTTPVHPGIVPEPITDPNNPLAGQVETAKDPGFDADDYDSVDDVEIEDLGEGDDVIIESDGYYTTAQTHGKNIGYDPGGGETIYPHEADVVAVGEDVEPGAESEEVEGEGDTPSEEEAESAVSEPAEEPHAAETVDYDLESYDPDDVDEFRDMSDIGASHGNSVSAMEVAVLPDGSKAVHKDVDHHTVSEDDIKRETAGYEAVKYLDDNVPVHAADVDAGWAVSEVVPGVDAKDATPEMKEAVETEDFVDMAAKQVIIGNSDLHQNNIRVDENGELYPFDLDRAAGDIQSDWVGNLTHYEDTLDRILGEMEKSANALGLSTGYGFREAIIERAEEVANDLDGPEQMLIQQDAGEVSEEFAETIMGNVVALSNGEVSP